MLSSAARRLAKVGAGAAMTAGILGGTAMASDDHIPPLDFGFSHSGLLSALDSASVRRGYQVYKEVCSTCHSLEGIAFRNLVGVTHTEEQIKAMAAEVEVEDGPNDEGEMFERPGKLSDKLPKPYPNDEAGRAANNGALPPDLTLMTKARHDGQNYVFALITGYCDAPAGKVMLPGLHYNPYFAGGAIGMPPPLQDGQVEYEDGTPATVTQMAKDVTTFLTWAAEPEHDQRKKMGMQWFTAMVFMAAAAGYYKRMRWAPLKTRKVSYIN